RSARGPRRLRAGYLLAGPGDGRAGTERSVFGPIHSSDVLRSGSAGAAPAAQGSTLLDEGAGRRAGTRLPRDRNLPGVHDWSVSRPGGPLGTRRIDAVVQSFDLARLHHPAGAEPSRAVAGRVGLPPVQGPSQRRARSAGHSVSQGAPRLRALAGRDHPCGEVAGTAGRNPETADAISSSGRARRTRRAPAVSPLR